MSRPLLPLFRRPPPYRHRLLVSASANLFFALCLLFTLYLAIIAPATASAANRVALIIGNGAYSHAARLDNPVNDASDMAAALTRLGFEVILAKNATGQRFADAAQRFIQKLEGAKVGLFFYAGHGLQYGGINYLLPVDARLRNSFSIRREAFQVSDLLAQMQASVPISIVLLDACRNNPLADQLKQRSRGQFRSLVGRGLARLKVRSGDALIVYATEPGKEAADGRGRNSPFTRALLANIATPGLEIEVMLKRVTRDVLKATRNAQQPERLSRLSQELYLAGNKAGTPVPPVPPTPVPPAHAGKDDFQKALEAWVLVEKTRSRAVLEAFITRYGHTAPGKVARQKLAALLQQQRPQPQPVKPPHHQQLPAASQPVSYTPQLIPIGKWPEEVVYDGRYLWIAESGQRTVARLDPRSWRVTKRYKVGRLPVEMIADSSGIYSLVHTDRKIWWQPKRGRARTFFRFPRSMGPDDLKRNGSNLYVLSWHQDGSGAAYVTRLRIGSRHKIQSPLLRLSNHHRNIAINRDGAVWVNASSNISILDPGLRNVTRRIPLTDWWAVDLFRKGNAFFATGWQKNPKTGRLVRYDADSQQLTHSFKSDTMIFKFAMIGKMLVGMTYDAGKLFVLDPDSLRTIRTIQLRRTFPTASPSGMAVIPDGPRAGLVITLMPKDYNLPGGNMLYIPMRVLRP